MDVVHYRNLTRGLMCPHVTPGHRVIRIQSTWCEQKRWGDLLMTLDADLYYRLAQGDRCVIHDLSERPRETRACWQGLSFIRYATSAAWGLAEVRELSRGGMNVTPYWARVYASLPNQVLNYLRYFRQYSTGRPVALLSCWGGSNGEAHRFVDTRELVGASVSVPSRHNPGRNPSADRAGLRVG